MFTTFSLEPCQDGLGVLFRGGLTAQVSSDVLALGNGLGMRQNIRKFHHQV